MRFYVVFKEGPARKAKRLKKALVAAGYDARLQRCQGLVAKMMGYRDWREMLTFIGRADPSPGDAFIDGHERESRSARHVAILVESGIGIGDAEAVVDAVGFYRLRRGTRTG